MHGVNSWAYHPYLPLTQQGKAMLPYVCRLAPGANAFAFEFFDQGFEGAHEIHLWRKGQSTPVTVLPLVGFEGFVEGLDTLTDYAFSVHRVGVAGQSDTRYVRTGKVPGTVIQYLHPEDDQYAFSGKSLCSPSIVRVPGGALLASMDVFASQYPQNLTLLYRSDDEGATWHYLTDLFPCFWGKLFVHKGALYMLATSTEYGDLLIGRSDDEGKTWTAPVRILPGSGKNSVGGPHKAPMPVIAYNGRLYTAIDYGTWNLGGHASGLLSIGEEEDLLVGSHWVCTPFLPYDP
ncbi:MAG: sialidase family protein, partial [Clostridia bacterium]